MPIQSPNFSVQQLSPASLLAGRRQQQDDNSIESIVNQFITFGLRERLNERQLEAYAANQRQGERAASERTFMQDVNEGVVTPVPEEGFNFETADGETIDISTFEAPPESRFAGQRYASSEDVLEARRQVALSQPAGEGYFEDVQLGDLVGPNMGSISEGQRLQLRRGDRERVINRYQEMADEVAAISPNLADAFKSEIEAIQNDQRFTEYEEQDYLNRATMRDLADFNSLARSIAEMEAERREEINGYVEHASRNLGLPSEDGRTTVPLSRDQQYVYSLWRSGNTDLPGWGEEEQQMLDEMLPHLRALPDAPAIQEQLTNWYVDAGRVDRRAHLDFVDWIISNTLEGDGRTIRNQALAEELRPVVGDDINRANVSEWAVHPRAARFRAAWAFFNNGTTSKDRIYELARTGMPLMHGLEGERGVNSAFRTLYGDDWGDTGSVVDPAPPPGGLGGGVGASTSGESLSIDVDGETISPEQGVQMLSDTFRQMAQTGGIEARRTLATVAANAEGAQEDLVNSLRETAKTYQRYAQEDEATEETAETYRLYSNWFGRLADRADSGYREYRMILEDMFYPALDESGAVEDMMDLSSYRR